jgi:hypothetical protein
MPDILEEQQDELTVSFSPVEESHFDKGGVLFLVTASVNGTTLPDVLDVDEFFKSLSIDLLPTRRSGKRSRLPSAQRYPLFNCTCGVFGCGGYYVDVIIRTDGLIWENIYATLDKHQEPFARWRYVFSWDNIREISGELIAAIHGAQAQSPSGEVRYGDTGVEVTERLPFYLERYQGLPGGIKAE